MTITLLPSSVADSDQHQYLTTYLVNGTVAIDAGSLGFYAAPDQQARVRHVILTHTHIDHTASLPIFLENVFSGRPDCVTVHASAETLEVIHRDLFNDAIWPDFFRMSTPDAPFLRFQFLNAGQPVEIDGLRFTPVPVDHAVPTLGLVVEAPGAAVVIPSDTGPTEAIWAAARATPDLKAVFLEASFPNHLAALAASAKHLTPELFALEAKKLPDAVRLLAVHVKARYRHQIVAELAALQLPNLELCQAGHTYEF
jgi:ribonuclease BN (tRNA processing enzyme)